MHELTINNRLMNTDPIMYRVRRVRRGRDLNLAPLTIGGGLIAGRCPLLELLIDSLLFYTTLSLDKGGVWIMDLVFWKR